ncbi:hypothetical protein ACFWX0_56750, partial [Nonomuraea sp. NPDC059022]
MSIPYIGSGPYCYANSLAMILGEEAPAPAVIEVLTGSPYGVQLIGGQLPLFDPFGWDPDQGLDAAIELLGWSCECSDGGGPPPARVPPAGAGARGAGLFGAPERGLVVDHP